MTLRILRAIAGVVAAATGLLLNYGFIYATEGMTTTVRVSQLHELGISTLWIVPWTILFCLGLEDFSAVTRRPWVFWAGAMLALILLYYFERNTSRGTVTKIGMPLLATAVGLLPHVIRRIHFVFNIFAIAFGVAALVIFYSAASSYLSGSFFSVNAIGFLVLTFGTSSFIAGVLSVALLRRRHDELA
jgi:hypothetical protein